MIATQQKALKALITIFLAIALLFADIRVGASAVWLSGWSYRKQITVSASAGAGTGYQILINCYYSSGTDGGVNIFLNYHSRADFGDVRYTNEEASQLDYWMQEKVDSDYAVFWVKVTGNLSVERQTIYVYYGKADATYPFEDDQDEMDNTFLFADHFYGGELNLDKWIVREGDVSVSDGALALTGTTGTRGRIDGLTQFNPQTAIHARSRCSALADIIQLIGARDGPAFNNAIILYWLEAWTLYCESSEEGAWENVFELTYPTTEFHIYRIFWELPKKVILYQDGCKEMTMTHGVPTVPLVYYYRESPTVDGDVYVDWVFVRKYVATEPAFTSGEEESRGGLTEMINVFALMLPLVGVVAGVAFIALFFSLAYSQNTDANDVIMKTVFAVTAVGVMILVMVAVNAMLG